jgi:nicotinate-nucleotide adenylyltransferase
MIGIFGGSFDPIHFGHIKLALALLENFEFEQIRFVPCHISPLKEKVFANEQHRWQMLNLVCSNQPKLIVDDRELKREGPSYTIDSLIEIREEIDNSQSLVLIVGVDAYLEFCKWYRYEEILSYCHLILMQRPGYSLSDLDLESEHKSESKCEKEYFKLNKTEDIKLLATQPHGKIYLSELEKIDISSTLIRKTIAQGKQPKYMLPGNVWNYVRRNKLYQP